MYCGFKSWERQSPIGNVMSWVTSTFNGAGRPPLQIAWGGHCSMVILHYYITTTLNSCNRTLLYYCISVIAHYHIIILVILDHNLCNSTMDQWQCHPSEVRVGHPHSKVDIASIITFTLEWQSPCLKVIRHRNTRLATSTLEPLRMASFPPQM